MAEILVIDDIEEARNTICKILKRSGYDVIEAHNGKEGLEALEQHHPDLILTDIIMPEMEGLEAIQKIKKLKPNIPIIAFTGSSDSPYLQVALKLGAVTGLYKPFSPKELIIAVRNVLDSNS